MKTIKFLTTGFPILIFSLIVAATAVAQTKPADNQSQSGDDSDNTKPVVLKRARLGNNAEDMEFIRSGRFANQLAIIDGFDVVGVPAMGHGHGGVRKLFGIKKLPLLVRPAGIGYVESERLFVLNDIQQPDQLIFSDDNGNPAGTRTVSFPAGTSVGGVEAIGYISRGSSFFPDHLFEVIYVRPDFTEQIEIIRRDGQVVSEIVPDAAIQEHGIGGVSYVRPDRFLVGTFDDLLYLIDLHGNIVAGPVTVSGTGGSCEGVDQTPDGRIVATIYDSGTVYYFDRDLRRLPTDDQSYKVGIGLSRMIGPACNPDPNELLFIGGTNLTPPLEAVPASLDARRQVANLATDGIDLFNVRDITYLPDEHRIGVSILGPQGVVLYGNNGMLQDFVDFSAAGRPTIAQYLSATQQFATWLRGTSNRGRIKIVSRNGVPIRSIDLRPLGVTSGFSLAYFDPTHPSGGQLLVLNPSGDALIMDLNGNLLSRFAYRGPLDLPFGSFGVTAITTGLYAG